MKIPCTTIPPRCTTRHDVDPDKRCSNRSSHYLICDGAIAPGNHACQRCVDRILPELQRLQPDRAWGIVRINTGWYDANDALALTFAYRETVEALYPDADPQQRPLPKHEDKCSWCVL